MNESELANLIIEARSDPICGYCNWESEVHYNHYGNRGVVDLVNIRGEDDGGKDTITIFELKSEYAIKQATGANEIIRQFNRHCEYFFEGTDHHRLDYYEIYFVLAFEATQSVYEHVTENWPLYETVADSNSKDKQHIRMYHPDYDLPLHFKDAALLPNWNARELKQNGWDIEFSTTVEP